MDSSNHSILGTQQVRPKDFATQIIWWRDYRLKCAEDNKPLGKYVSPMLAEHMSGRHLNNFFKFLDCITHCWVSCGYVEAYQLGGQIPILGLWNAPLSRLGCKEAMRPDPGFQAG